MKWIIDPKTKEESVSLTFLSVSFCLLIVVGAAALFKKVDNVSIFDSLFYSTAGLYFGRRISFNKDSKEIDKS